MAGGCRERRVADAEHSGLHALGIAQAQSFGESPRLGAEGALGVAGACSRRMRWDSTVTSTAQCAAPTTAELSRYSRGVCLCVSV